MGNHTLYLRKPEEEIVTKAAKISGMQLHIYIKNILIHSSNLLCRDYDEGKLYPNKDIPQESSEEVKDDSPEGTNEHLD